jgi:hypothetical protein
MAALPKIENLSSRGDASYLDDVADKLLAMPNSTHGKLASPVADALGFQRMRGGSDFSKARIADRDVKLALAILEAVKEHCAKDKTIMLAKIYRDVAKSQRKSLEAVKRAYGRFFGSDPTKMQLVVRPSKRRSQ